MKALYLGQERVFWWRLGAVCRPEDVLRGRRRMLEQLARDLDPGQLEKVKQLFERWDEGSRKELFELLGDKKAKELLKQLGVP